MSWTIFPSSLCGRVQVPPSKSQSIRALIFAMLSSGKSKITNLLDSTDVQRVKEICEQFGSDCKEIIDVGNSGLALRFFTAIAALYDKPIMITGDESIRTNRKILPLLEGLGQVGVKYHANGDYAPLMVQGPMQPGWMHIDGEDSQFVSALLIAAAYGPGPTEIFVSNPGEKPWVNLTLSWLDRLAIPYERKDFSYFRLLGDAQTSAFTYRVPADFSSCAFAVVAALITDSELLLEGLDFSDAQGDKQFLSLLEKMGARFERTDSTLEIKKGSRLTGMQIDVNEFIDALPILSVLSCFAEGKTEIVGAKVARGKECDRLAAITQELKKMGGKIEEHESGITIYPSSLKGAELQSHADHRMAMALAVAALGAEGKSIVHGSHCAAKTYPQFAEHFVSLGARIE